MGGKKYKTMKVKFNISIFLTWSKVMALVILIMSFVIDWANKVNGNVFMFALPFVVFLISGKQFFDRNKHDPESPEKIIDATIENNIIEAKSK